MTRLALTIPEAAEAAGVTDKKIRADIATGALKAKRQSRNSDGVGVGRYLIKVTDLDAWFDGLADA